MPTLTHQPFLTLVSEGKVKPVPTGPDRTHVDQAPPSTPPPDTKRRRVTPEWQRAAKALLADVEAAGFSSAGLARVLSPEPEPEDLGERTDSHPPPPPEPEGGAEMAAKKKRGNAKLSPADRAAIVRRARKSVAARRKGLDAESYADIAKAFGRRPAYVYNLVAEANKAGEDPKPAKPARVADAQVASAVHPKRKPEVERARLMDHAGQDMLGALGALIDARVESRLEALVEARVKAAFLRFAQQGVG